MRHFSLEHRNNLRLAQMGKKKDQSTKEKISASLTKTYSNPEVREKLKGPKDESTKQKMAEAARNRPAKTCPHCGKQGTSNVMVRWHFDNCRNKC